jgi:hypothetical protein
MLNRRRPERVACIVCQLAVGGDVRGVCAALTGDLVRRLDVTDGRRDAARWNDDDSSFVCRTLLCGQQCRPTRLIHDVDLPPLPVQKRSNETDV